MKVFVYYIPWHDMGSVTAQVTEEEAQRNATIFPENIYFFEEEE